MKLPIPSLRDIERVTRVIPVLKDLLPNRNESDSSLLNIIKQQEDALTDKKAEICKLRETVAELKTKLLDLNENLENCQYELKRAGDDV